MKIIICKQCKEEVEKYEREGSIFCNRECYMIWKRDNPNKKAYKEKIIVNNYAYMYQPGHEDAIKNGRYIAEHRLVMEKKLGRKLFLNEVVHHIDGNTLNNNPDNLEAMLRNEHDRLNASQKERDQYGKFI